MKYQGAIAVIIIILITSLLVVGCAAPKTPATTPTPPQTTPQTTTPASPPASTPTAPPSPGAGPAPATTSTAGQLADAGKTVFADNCAKCHGANGEGGGSPALIGSKANLGKYSTAQALFDFVTKQMPLGKAGTLSAQEYLQVVAFLLVQNGLVQPSAALDATTLGTIKTAK
jgi:mono/diheme cytochrome c family protein